MDFEVNGCIPHNAMRSGCLTLSCRTVDIFGASRARAAEESPFGSEEILQKMLEERMIKKTHTHTCSVIIYIYSIYIYIYVHCI